ncbi:hypothetical protein PRCB_00520 [Pantoea rodasii]|uniref:Uncharacterized protein n=1 Tax=Pantoea rodasii TaxID=1076549 RepID=A0A2M9WI00_9GAMM|nr:hypothetical protein [Pantoea rodasii]ORM61353.1 hypothetical protein HA45_20790 [Pantoea rodasii]PJZ07185.1 hypothetical protein PRCB_00520 [Pantoea rodasii]
MRDNEIDIHYYATEIRKLAAAHQAGETLSDVKTRVDLLIQQMKETLGSDKAWQAKNWEALLNQLNIYLTNKVDPKWMTVISHAKFRIKSRRQTAIYSRKHFKQ